MAYMTRPGRTGAEIASPIDAFNAERAPALKQDSFANASVWRTFNAS